MHLQDQMHQMIQKWRNGFHTKWKQTTKSGKASNTLHYKTHVNVFRIQKTILRSIQYQVDQNDIVINISKHFFSHQQYNL